MMQRKYASQIELIEGETGMNFEYRHFTIDLRDDQVLAIGKFLDEMLQEFDPNKTISISIRAGQGRLYFTECVPVEVYHKTFGKGETDND